MTRRTNKGRAFFVAAAFLGVLCLWVGTSLPARTQSAPNATTITILGTTDIHGNLEPVDYYAAKEANRGLVKIATLVKRERAATPDALLLDCGDTIQGTPLAYFFAVQDKSKLNPTIAVMNAMRYDAAALGNHEFNYGLDVLWKAKSEAKFPILAANLEQEYKPDAREYFKPYILKTVSGVRIAILGFVTPGVPRWEIPGNYRGYKFVSIVDTARRLILEVRKQADLIVVIAHSGLGPDPETRTAASADELSGENAIFALAEQAPGIDVILFGHTHQEVSEKFVHGALLVQPKNWAQSLARVEVTMDHDPQGAWHVASKHSVTIPVTADVPVDAETAAIAAPYEKYTEEMLDKPLATSAKDMWGDKARYEDDPLVDLIHTVQLEASHADVSLATMFMTAAHIPQGQVTARNIASLYIYSNTLYAVEMTGAQLKLALEHAASFFPAWPFPPGERVRLPGYNADSAEGVDYVIDLTKPVGDRIRDLTYKGKPLDPNQQLRVAINNYRYTGGGHYDIFAGLPIVYRSQEEVRDLIIEYVARKGVVPTTADNNWRIEPKEALEAILTEAKRQESTPSTR